jgi:hypothetical protein
MNVMRRFLCLCCLAAVASGCGEAEKAGPDQNKLLVGLAPANAQKPPAPPAGGQEKAADRKPEERKIIFTAEVDLVADDFEKARTDLLNLVKEREGYVAKSELHGTPGSPRWGKWTVRVPVSHFDDFLELVGKVGELRRSTKDSSDITDAYYDMQAHMKNNETREDGLRKLYQSKAATGKLEDLLAIDREMSDVRGKIDTQKGQLQRWDKEVAYSTATVMIQDRLAYVPPVPASFSGTVGRTWSGSIDALVNAGRGLVLGVVALAPWVVVLAVLGAPVWYRIRRARRL